MADILIFPTDVSKFEKIMKKVIKEHYSHSEQEKASAELAGAEVVNVLRNINKNRPKFNLSIDLSDPVESEKSIKIAVKDFSDKYANIISSLLGELFKEKIKNNT